MHLGQILMLAVTAFAAFLGWSYMRGRSHGIDLSAVWLVVVGSLVAAGVSEAVGRPGAVETFNVVAIVLSLAGLVGAPSLWEDQLRRVSARAQRAGSLAVRDILSWQVWLRLARQVGAARAALIWLALFAVAVAANLGAAWGTRSAEDRAYVVAALAAPMLFGLLSTLWMYRGMQRTLEAREPPQPQSKSR